MALSWVENARAAAVSSVDSVHIPLPQKYAICIDLASSSEGVSRAYESLCDLTDVGADADRLRLAKVATRDLLVKCVCVEVGLTDKIAFEARLIELLHERMRTNENLLSQLHLAFHAAVREQGWQEFAFSSGARIDAVRRHRVRPRRRKQQSSRCDDTASESSTTASSTSMLELSSPRMTIQPPIFSRQEVDYEVLNTFINIRMPSSFPSRRTSSCPARTPAFVKDP